MKNIKDYLHLYLGGTVKVHDGEFPMTGFSHTEKGLRVTGVHPNGLKMSYSKFKLILRPLSDMTEEEAKEGRKMFDDMVADDKLNGEIEAARTVLLLSKHFDLFGLIESGLAIDKTKQP